MPSVSESQQKLMGMALHHPGKLYKRNRSVLGMKRSDMREFAETKHKGLPEKIGSKARKRMRKRK